MRIEYRIVHTRLGKLRRIEDTIIQQENLYQELLLTLLFMIAVELQRG